MTAYREVAAGLRLPEGPIALPQGDLLVVEVAAARLTRISLDGSRKVVAQWKGGPNGAAIGPDGRCFVCNNGGMSYKERDGRLYGHTFLDEPGSIEAVDLATGDVEVIYRECDGVPLSAPNDLVFDGHGGFWFTDHGKVFRDHLVRGAIFYAKADGSFIKRAFAPMDGPNGIGLSPDAKRLYVAETATARVWAFDLSSPGEIATSSEALLGRRGHLLVGLPGYQMLDSLAVDEEGWVCVATIINGGITAISPDGSQVEHIALPDKVTTNICFGGPDRSTAYVTLGSTGKVVSLKWPRAGLKLMY